jgi:hypothetical protein
MNHKNNKIELMLECIILEWSLSNGVRNIVIARSARK